MGIERSDWSVDPPTEESTSRAVVPTTGDGLHADWDKSPPQGVADDLLSTQVLSAVDGVYGRSEIGSDEHMAARARGVMETIFRNLGSDAGALSEKINGLPDDVFRAIDEHIALLPGAGHRLAADEVAALSTGEAGEALAKLWRSRAGRNFGVLDMRLHSIEEALDDAGKKAFAEFVGNMTPREMISVARALTGT